MAFCRKVNYSINVVLFKDALNLTTVADINLFKKIPNENNVVSWNTSFGFDVTLFQERSEPKWTF